jgi:hypothetical protein
LAKSVPFGEVCTRLARMFNEQPLFNSLVVVD